jgi:hypothetical protein
VSRQGDWLSYNAHDEHTPLGGLVCMPSGSGKTRVVAALIDARPVPTLVVVNGPTMAQHWARELEHFACPVPPVITTWSKMREVDATQFQRIVYDDCVKHVASRPLTTTSAVSWALTTPGEYAQVRPSVWLRFIFAASQPGDGLLGMVCHDYARMTKAHNVVYAQLMSVLMFSEPVPPCLLPVCVSSTCVSTPTPEWLGEYTRCWRFVQAHRHALFSNNRNIAGRFLGAVAGSAPFDTADELGTDNIGGADMPDMCAICHEAFTEPHRTPCNHYFCELCIREWLATNPSCPMCRLLFLLFSEFLGLNLAKITADSACQGFSVFHNDPKAAVLHVVLLLLGLRSFCASTRFEKP